MAGPRMPSSSCRTACASISAPASGGAAGNFGRRGRRGSRRTATAHPDLADQLERMQKRELPDGWDAGPAEFPRRCQGPCEPRFLRQGAERHRAALSLAHRRLGRPRAVDQDAPHVRRRRRFRGRQIRRPQSSFRHSRACHGRDPERARTVQDSRLRLELPDLFRLHEAADPLERADGAAGHLHLHA